MIYNENIPICSGYLCPLKEYCKLWANGIAYDHTVYKDFNDPKVHFISAKYNDKTNKCINFINFSAHE